MGRLGRQTLIGIALLAFGLLFAGNPWWIESYRTGLLSIAQYLPQVALLIAGGALLGARWKTGVIAVVAAAAIVFAMTVVWWHFPSEHTLFVIGEPHALGDKNLIMQEALSLARPAALWTALLVALGVAGRQVWPHAQRVLAVVRGA